MRATKVDRESLPAQTPGLGRRILHILALDPEHADPHVAMGFLAGGLAHALPPGVSARSSSASGTSAGRRQVSDG